MKVPIGAGLDGIRDHEQYPTMGKGKRDAQLFQGTPRIQIGRSATVYERGSTKRVLLRSAPKHSFMRCMISFLRPRAQGSICEFQSSSLGRQTSDGAGYPSPSIVRTNGRP